MQRRRQVTTVAGSRMTTMNSEHHSYRTWHNNLLTDDACASQVFHISALHTRFFDTGFLNIRT